MNDLSQSPFKNKLSIFCTVFFVLVSIWWLTIYNRELIEGRENNAFTLIYPWMSLIGGIAGIVSAKRWGGLKSYFGRAITFLSLGLLLQFLGQAIYAYFIYVRQVEVPYPSLGDIGYFGSIIAYIIGALLLGKVVGLKNKLISAKGQIFAFVVPLLLLTITYFIFLNHYEFNNASSLTILLDFGYPIGEAIYVAIAIICLVLSRNVLGGIMRKPILFLVLSLIVQYFCDFTFLYQANQGTWHVGGANDYLYFLSYFCMSLSLIYIGSIFKHLKNN